MWALGPEHEPFGKVASDFNCWAIYPAPYYCILQKGFIPQSQNSKNYKLRISTMKPRCLCPSGNPENLLNLGITKLISSMFSSNFIIYHLYDPAECLVLQTGKLYSIYEKKFVQIPINLLIFFFLQIKILLVILGTFFHVSWTRSLYLACFPIMKVPNHWDINKWDFTTLRTPVWWKICLQQEVLGHLSIIHPLNQSRYSGECTRTHTPRRDTW